MTGGAVTRDLPVQLTSFVGRESELTEIGRLLTGSRLLTLTGAGGSGKTRLAMHAAAEVAERCRDGVRWVEFGPVSAPEAVPYAVARACGLVEEEARPLVDTLREQLVGLDALLLLDNCEHVLEPCAHLVEALLRAAPGLRIMVTSREPLGVPGEIIWRVPSLDDDTGARLFIERARQARPGFAAHGSEIRVIVEICRRLDGLPLAIELAAARVRMMAPAQIAAALQDPAAHRRGSHSIAPPADPRDVRRMEPRSPRRPRTGVAAAVVGVRRRLHDRGGRERVLRQRHRRHPRP
jgi:predicted ATPase